MFIYYNIINILRTHFTNVWGVPVEGPAEGYVKTYKYVKMYPVLGKKSIKIRKNVPARYQRSNITVTNNNKRERD